MRWLGVVALIVLAVLAACTSKTRDLLERPYDAGADGEIALDAAPDVASPDASDLGAPCRDDSQCDDRVACTFDACDPALQRCRNVPDDSRCDDGSFCDGREACDRTHGCVPGPVVTCEDGDSCTIDRCVEATKGCLHAPRDVDLDGDPDDHCVSMRDCDDADPTVASTHAEVCANGKDDNCDGHVDEMPCVDARGDSCATAVPLAVGTTTTLSTRGTNEDYAKSCGLSNPAGARDVVGVVQVPAGGSADLEVWATTGGPEVAIAIQAACGDAKTELACASAPGASSMRARARGVAPGTYYVIVTVGVETNVDVRVSLLTPSPKPTNEDCASAAPLALDVSTAVSLVDPSKDLASACGGITGELTYAITLAAPSDLRVYASTTLGSGSPVLGLRDAHCTDAADEIACKVPSALPLFVRDLAAGTYVLTVAATAPIDLSVLAHADPATTPPADQTCAAPPPAAVDRTVDVDLSNHDDSIKDGCLPGGPTAAVDLSLAAASDLLVVGRFPTIETGAVSLDTPACTEATRLACAPGGTPVRFGRRGVAAGDYRVVVTDQIGATATLTTLVRAAVAPTTVTGGDSCAAPYELPASGGFFTGDTSNDAADFDDGCDTPSVQPGGAPDQVLHLALAADARVVFSMEGSTYTTILDVRSGATCPGTTIQGGCYVGFGAAKSFLDVPLAAGDYWVIVDGYGGAHGAWNLDVWVLPP